MVSRRQCGQGICLGIHQSSWTEGISFARQALFQNPAQEELLPHWSRQLGRDHLLIFSDQGMNFFPDRQLERVLSLWWLSFASAEALLKCWHIHIMYCKGSGSDKSGEVVDKLLCFVGCCGLESDMYLSSLDTEFVQNRQMNS